MPLLNRLREFLELHEVDFKHTVHPPAYTAREVASAEHLPLREVAKVVIILAETGYQMVVLPACMAVDLAELRPALGFTHARLATEAEIGGLFPDCQVGAMPPFGNLYRLPVYADSSLALDKWIAFNAGTHQDVVHMRFEDFKRLVDPTILPLAREMSPGRAW